MNTNTPIEKRELPKGGSGTSSPRNGPLTLESLNERLINVERYQVSLHNSVTDLEENQKKILTSLTTLVTRLTSPKEEEPIIELTKKQMRKWSIVIKSVPLATLYQCIQKWKHDENGMFGNKS